MSTKKVSCARQWKAGYRSYRYVHVLIVYVIVVAAAHVNQFDGRPCLFIDVALDVTVGRVIIHKFPWLLHASVRNTDYVGHDVPGDICGKLSDGTLFFVPAATSSNKSHDCSYAVPWTFGDAF